MGVSKLWNILEPVRKTVALRDLADQVLAIDLSIWIHEASGVCTAPCMCFVHHHHHHLAKRNDSPFNMAYAVCLLLLGVCYILTTTTLPPTAHSHARIRFTRSLNCLAKSTTHTSRSSTNVPTSSSALASVLWLS